MCVENIIAGLSGKTAEERKHLRADAEKWAASATPTAQAEARALLEALKALGPTPMARARPRAKTKPLAPPPQEIERLGLGERVSLAFDALPPTESDRRLLDALLTHPGATSEELSAAMGYKGRSGWHLQFGLMVQRRLGWIDPQARANADETTWLCAVLAKAWNTRQGCRFRMKPEVVAALAKLGIATRAKRAR